MNSHFKPLGHEELCNMLCEKKRTLIVYHVRSDADAVGSAFALRRLLFEMGVPAYCACAEEIPQRLRFLCGGAQGSVLIDEDMKLDCQRVISVDSASGSQLGALFTRLHKNVDIMIDHHRMGSVYADYYIDPDAAATGEIIYEIGKRLLQRGDIDCLSPEFYMCIYAAISSDTGGFRFSNTTPRTHRIAAEILESGIDAAQINSLLFESKSRQQIVAEGICASNLKEAFSGRVAYSTISRSAVEELGFAEEDLSTLIDIPRSLEAVELAFILKPDFTASGFRASMRASSDIDVSRICAAFGGGGHKKAAGCSLNAASVEDAANMLLCEIEKYL